MMSFAERLPVPSPIWSGQAAAVGLNVPGRRTPGVAI